jgi:hypothetical protein
MGLKGGIAPHGAVLGFFGSDEFFGTPITGSMPVKYSDPENRRLGLRLGVLPKPVLSFWCGNHGEETKVHSARKGSREER